MTERTDVTKFYPHPQYLKILRKQRKEKERLKNVLNMPWVQTMKRNWTMVTTFEG